MNVLGSLCPVSTFDVDVPKDRVTDTGPVAASGPCQAPSVYPAATYTFIVTGMGVCHVTVHFQSGAPDFVTDMKITRSPPGCCGNAPVAETTVVYVPESGPADAATDN
jgi:hypothetical protein